eukprot:4222214-Pleurochrysis_carterae.AAC.1
MTGAGSVRADVARGRVHADGRSGGHVAQVCRGDLGARRRAPAGALPAQHERAPELGRARHGAAGDDTRRGGTRLPRGDGAAAHRARGRTVQDGGDRHGPAQPLHAARGAEGHVGLAARARANVCVQAGATDCAALHDLREHSQHAALRELHTPDACRRVSGIPRQQKLRVLSLQCGVTPRLGKRADRASAQIRIDPPESVSPGAGAKLTPAVAEDLSIRIRTDLLTSRCGMSVRWRVELSSKS